jgi:hypothetical protein
MTYVVHQPLESMPSHFYAIKATTDRMHVEGFDSMFPRFHLHMSVVNVVKFFATVANARFFVLGQLDSTAQIPTGAAYECRGAGVHFCKKPAGAPTCKRPAAYIFPGPKRGKWRMYARPQRLDKSKFSSLFKQTKYVRHGRRECVRRVRAKWSMSLKRLKDLTDLQLITELTRTGFLKDWTQGVCPHCDEGKVGSLRKKIRI